MNDDRKRIAIDFDGVIHSYVSGWKGSVVIPDPPVPGAFEFLEEALKHYNVVIHSTRAMGKEEADAMQEWMLSHGCPKEVVEKIWITNRKVKAMVYIDDRGWRFEGIFPTMEELGALKKWYK